jgi:hypothetical protein
VSASDRKGQTLEKVYTKSTPTVVVWDPSHEDGRSCLLEDDEGEGDRVWEDMENAGNSEDEDGETSDDEVSTNSIHKKSRTE